MASGRMMIGWIRSWPFRGWIVAIAAALCSVGAVHPAAARQAASAANPSGLVVTPGSRQAMVASQLASMAAGQRILVMRGFADDIASRDTIRVTTVNSKTKRPSTSTVQSPWLDQGVASARSRIASWMRTLATQGAVVDAVRVLPADPGLADRLSRLTHPNLRTIAADSRYAGLVAQDSALTDVAAVISAGATNSPWSRAMQRQVSNAVIAAHAQGVAQSFPKAAVTWWTPEPTPQSTAVGGVASVTPPPATPPATPPTTPPATPPTTPPATPPTTPPATPPTTPPATPPVLVSIPTSELTAITDATRSKALQALAAVGGARRTADWSGTLSYRAQEWAAIFDRARDSAALRQQLVALANGAKANVLNADPALYRRPMTIAQIHPSQLTSRAAAAGPNREVFALAMADCGQSEFVRRQGMELAIAAVYLQDQECLNKCIDILRACKDRFPLQRAGWTAYEPTSVIPQGGDGVWLATSWGISGIVDMLSLLGDRVPSSLRADLNVLLRREVELIARDWADQRPWYVKGRAVQSNQWIEPCVGLIKATLFLGDRDLLPAYNLGVESLAASLAMQGSDGAFMEGVSYASMTVGMLFEALDDLRLNNDMRCHAMPFVGNCWSWFVHMHMPGRQYVNTYDSRMSAIPAWAISTPLGSIVQAALGSCDARAIPVLRTLFPAGNASVAGVRYEAALAALGSGAAQYLPTSSHFQSQQQVTWRSAWEAPSQPQSAFALFVRGGSRLDSHSHRDQGQVSVYMGDRIILMDCGTPDYGQADLETKYARAAGHGIMQIGERLPRNMAVDAPITVERLDDSGGKLRVDTTAAYQGVRLCQRNVEWQASGRVVMQDRVELEQSVPAGTEFYRLHTGATSPVTITQASNGWTVSWPGVVMSISADAPIVVEQVAWPDAVREPFMHQALIIRSADARSTLQVRTQVDVARSAAGGQ